ncbi:UDP-N-acetylmuramate dehydrogenase [Lacticaseibacillus mingshuiensis]|uniref:UDP-N-acetylenolpyruvoylglucosamine reductase n=1 Tax=Lacticaseibacillus mingshuiensis TaxID=2799574 RepID=A0ABW4CHW3_9LACO|nr:UDP-N-acetylmuramate dehydrogenase [Lacticaseibacillus mingshuiensis]
MTETGSFGGLSVHLNEPLSHFTFTQTGGPADLLALPTSVGEVQQLLAEARAQALPVTVIGNASNLIVKDGGIRGLVILLTKMTGVTCDGTQLIAEAGARLIDVTEVAYQAGLGGLAFAAGIPGSIGGAVFMNAGAYGGEICDVLASAEVLTRDGQLKTYSNEDMQFAYRHSLVQDTGDIVLRATFALTRQPRPQIRAAMDHFNSLRASKQPLDYPSCGSVFKRPAGHFVGPMIQQSGLQGHIIGGAQISEKHAGFIVNLGGATASDYLAMIHYVQEHVAAKFGVALHPEVRIIGSDVAKG